MVTIRTLDNGIRVALESISYVRSISFGIWVKNGSRNELPQENGVSHYIIPAIIPVCWISILTAHWM